MNSDPGCTFVFWLILIVGVLCALTKYWRDAKLRRENPEAWVRLKEIENDKQRRQLNGTRAMQRRPQDCMRKGLNY